MIRQIETLAFWSAVVSMAIIGFGALFVPEPSSRMYGLPNVGLGLAFVRALGVRDICLAVLLATLAITGAKRRVLGICLLCMVMIPVADGLIVALSGSNNPWALALHGSAIPLFLWLGIRWSKA